MQLIFILALLKRFCFADFSDYADINYHEPLRINI